MNTQINIAENGTTTLATAGKYCDRNIDINVNVPAPDADYTPILDGTIEGEYTNDKVTKLKFAAFYGCGKLTHISLPNCVEAESGNTFQNCVKVQTIQLPNLASITGGAARAFFGLRTVKEIDLPSLITAPNMQSTFEGCQFVEKISLPKLGGTTIAARAFASCYYLHTIVFGGDAINTLANTNAFSQTGIYAENGFSIYVPDNLVDSYKTATNWTAYADKIKPISELEG